MRTVDPPSSLFLFFLCSNHYQTNKKSIGENAQNTNTAEKKKKCRQSLLSTFPPSNLAAKKKQLSGGKTLEVPAKCWGWQDGSCIFAVLQGRVPPPNGARRIWSGRGDRGRHWTSGARNYGTWRHYGALKQVTQPRFSSFRCQLNLSGGALAGKNAFLI